MVHDSKSRFGEFVLHVASHVAAYAIAGLAAILGLTAWFTGTIPKLIEHISNLSDYILQIVTLPVATPRWQAVLGIAFVPAALFIVAAGIVKLLRKPQKPNTVVENTKSLLPLPQFPKIRYDPDSEFTLLPLHFTVDLAAGYPQVEVRFYVVSFLPRPIKLLEVDLSLQLYSRPALEDINFRTKDIHIDPKDSPVIICRRQLSNAELTTLPWQAGRVPSSSYQLSAKATDGETTFSYGPVSSKIIEGWVNAPATNTQQPPQPDEEFISEVVPFV